jgi:type IX secretion system PorP/SprF family membrane protein
MKRLILGAGALVLATSAAFGQDVHFTQYFSSPLTLNPALTGLVSCDLRVAANYRSQWSSVSANPFVTGTASYDMNVLKGRLPEGDRVGLGVIALYDKSGIGALTNTTFGFSAAYHKGLGRGDEKNHTVSVGLQGSLVQKSLDYSKLRFADQFDPATGTTTNQTRDVNANQDVTYPDFSAGLMYTGRITTNSTAYAGFSTYHLTTPIESFKGSDSTRIHRRYTAYLGGSFKLNENIYLYASGLYQSQAKASEIMTGAAVGFVLNPGFDEEFQRPTILYAGAWYRYADAVCPYIGLDFKKATIGLSYDVNVSSFTPATQANGAYELSVTFNGCINKRDPQPRYNFACPKF